MDHDLARRLVAAYPDVWARGAYSLPGTLETWACGFVPGIFAPEEWTKRGALPDLDCPATAGILLTRLLREDPTARVSIEARESGHLIRIVVTGRDGRRHAVSGAVLGRVCAAALVALTTPPTE